MRKKVFIVEDETLLLDFITDFIESNPDFEIVGACSDGQQAVSQCFEADPDLVILVLHLPGLNGVEVLKSVRKRNPRLKVLIFSSTYNGPLLRRVIEAGADGFIDKVAGLKEFSKAMETILKGGKYFNESVVAAVAQCKRESVGEDSWEGLSEADFKLLDKLATGNSYLQN